MLTMDQFFIREVSLLLPSLYETIYSDWDTGSRKKSRNVYYRNPQTRLTDYVLHFTQDSSEVGDKIQLKLFHFVYNNENRKELPQKKIIAAKEVMLYRDIPRFDQFDDFFAKVKESQPGIEESYSI